MEEILVLAMIYGLSRLGARLIAMASNRRIDRESQSRESLNTTPLGVLDTDASQSV